MALSPCPEPLKVSANQVGGLDLSPLGGLASLAPAALLTAASGLQIDFDWPRDAEDPRELSEIAELRLWSLRADALHPWLPLVLERSGGQLTRHVAMLLPHGFSPTEGIRFGPESLELWITQRLFLLDHWAAAGGIECRANLGQMAAVLGYELDPGFWSVIP
ncbi:CRR6 family NdhI maturation factor [Synechococcus sp. CS-1332]|uniref:CRR6 family NdhI maturation factor n=1 Tax=Synechococcus sp. CS-1332 TaxID=2847972 RepID=UPI00223B5662|nr:CRR6 family NdhI maturation factor [Synechococcus sp. CS-1332]MCT0207835.1 CRR6 family NdhI maturation factor [Synechococcus sp. CS-1332]